MPADYQSHTIVNNYVRRFGAILAYDLASKRWRLFSSSRDFIRLTPVLTLSTIKAMAEWCLEKLREDVGEPRPVKRDKKSKDIAKKILRKKRRAHRHKK